MKAGLLILLNSFMFAVSSELREYCQLTSFNPSCPIGSVIKIHEARYGRMNLGECLKRDYGHIGCGVDAVSVIASQCSGRVSCDVPIPHPQLHLISTCPVELSAFLLVSYSCVPVAMGDESSCLSYGRVTISQTSGIIASAVTVTSGAIGSESCPWFLELPEGRRADIVLSYFSGNDVSSGNIARSFCRAIVTLREPSGPKPRTLCAKESSEEVIYTTQTNRLEIRILGSKTQPAYFILNYTMVGCPQLTLPADSMVKYENEAAVVTCKHTAKVFKLICLSPKWEGPALPRNCSMETLAADQNWDIGALVTSGFRMSMELSISLIITIAVLVVFAILIIGLVIIRRKRELRERQRSNNTLLAGNYPTSIDPYSSGKSKDFYNTSTYRSCSRGDNRYNTDRRNYAGTCDAQYTSRVANGNDTLNRSSLSNHNEHIYESPALLVNSNLGVPLYFELDPVKESRRKALESKTSASVAPVTSSGDFYEETRNVC